MSISEKSSCNKRGIFAVLVGPDGCGKSTITSIISETYREHFSGLLHFHWRPNLLPKLNPRPTNTTPPDEHPGKTSISFRKQAVSLIRFLYYWLDFVIGYWFIIYPKLRTNHLVIGERYFLDVIVNPKRYGFFLPDRLICGFSYLVPGADITILLSDEPERIYKRKQELTVDQIARQLAAYKEGLTGNPTAQIIETTESADIVASTIMEALVITQCDRNAADKWRVFPGNSNAKVIFKSGTRLCDALDLYQPYSSKGQVIKWLASIVPDILAKRMFSRKSIEAQAISTPIIKALGTAKDIIKSDFSSVAISQGTPGPHQKSTTQLINSAKQKVYLKSGRSDVVIQLIKNEASILQNLAGIPEIAAQVPELIHIEIIDSHGIICQSGPTGQTTQRDKHPTSQDIEFLHSLFSSDHKLLTFNQLEDTWNISERIDRLAKSDYGKANSSLLLEAWNLSRKSFQNSNILTGLCHGDYAPWNTLCDAKNNLFVYDWEYGTNSGPAMGDLFHCIFTPLILIEGNSASGITASLKESTTPLRKPVNDLASRLNISISDIPKYLLLYFIWQCVLRSEIHAKNNLPAQSHSDDSLLHAMNDAIKYLLATEDQEARPRMIVSAYACESDQGSEPGVGWNWSQLLSENNEVWVYTRANNRESIESGLRSTSNPYLHFEYLDLPRWATFWKKGSRGIRTYYYLWQIAALGRARQLHANVGFARGHHVTFVNDWLWSFLAFLNIQFVWGPIGSNSHSPLNLLPHNRARAQEIARRVIQQFFRWLDPLHWLTMKRASTILTINAQIANSIPLKWVAGKKTLVEPAIAINPVSEQAREPNQTGILKILYVGKLLPIKGSHLAVEAFADFAMSHDNTQLVILGDGPERENIQNRISKLGIDNKVEFLGWRPLDEVSGIIRDCDIFLFPTMEGAGLAVLEAMSCSLPCVCLDFGGPGTFLNKNCARLIPIDSKKIVIRGLSNALLELSNDAELRHTLGLNARTRVTEKYSWLNKKEQIKLLSTISIGNQSHNQWTNTP